MVKNLNRIFFILLLITSINSVSSQNISVSGKVVFSSNKSPVEHSTVRIYKNDKDTILIKGAISDSNGSFTFNNLFIGKFFVRIDYMGYSKAFKNFELTKQTGKELNLGTIILKSSSIALKEATVVGRAAEITVKQDTIEYNPATYKLQPGSAVEDMLKRMSGVDIDLQGKITIAGKEVKKIFVDGKQYFGKDPTVASKNIPVEIIEKLQVIDKKSDLAILTGIDDGDEETVINLTIKKGMKQGWIINAKEGIGKETDQLKKGETRYESNALVNRFMGESQFALIMNSNNVNIKPSRDWGTNNNSQMGMRGGRSTSAGNGITTSNVYGTNFAIETNDKFKMGGNVLYNNYLTDAKKTSVQTPLLDSVPYNSGKYNSYGKSENFSIDMKMEYRPDSFFTFIFTPTINYNRSTSNSDTQTFTFEGLNRDSVNRSFTNPSNHSDGYNINGRLDMSYQFKKKGRRLSFSLESGTNRTTGSGINYSNTHYYVANRDSILDQTITNKSASNSYRFYAAYMEPVGVNNFLQLSYSFRLNNSLSDKYTYKKNIATSQYSILDTAYSKSLDNDFINQQIGLSFRSVREKYNYTLGVDLEPSYTNSKRFVGDKIINQLDGRSVVNIAPNLNYTYRYSREKNLRIDYRGRTSQPSISQLDPTPDISNPLKIRQGNPELLPSYSNNLTIRYSNMNRTSQSSLMASLVGSYVFNDIITKSTYDNKGIEYSSYINQTGNWSLNGMFMLNTPIGNGGFQINTFSNGYYDNKIGYTSIKRQTQRNVSNTLKASENIGLTYRNDFIYCQLRGIYNYTETNNSLSINNLQTNSYAATFITQLYLPQHFIISSDVKYTANRGLTSGYNKDETLWNAELSKLVFKKQQGTISLKVYDILNQQLNISRNFTNYYIEDVEYNTLTSYFLFSFSYRFNSFGGKSRGQSRDSERHDGRDPRFENRGSDRFNLN